MTGTLLSRLNNTKTPRQGRVQCFTVSLLYFTEITVRNRHLSRLAFLVANPRELLNWLPLHRWTRISTATQIDPLLRRVNNSARIQRPIFVSRCTITPLHYNRSKTTNSERDLGHPQGRFVDRPFRSRISAPITRPQCIGVMLHRSATSIAIPRSPSPHTLTDTERESCSCQHRTV